MDGPALCKALKQGLQEELAVIWDENCHAVFCRAVLKAVSILVSWRKESIMRRGFVKPITDLKEMQSIQLDIMKKIHEFCEEKEIAYLKQLLNEKESQLSMYQVFSRLTLHLLTKL